jgi:hypothetical protein
MLREALFVSRFMFGSEIFFCLGDEQMLLECTVPFHTGHQIRHLAYKFRRLFSLAVACPFYSEMYTYVLYLEVSVSATSFPLLALSPYIKCILPQIYEIIFMCFRKICEKWVLATPCKSVRLRGTTLLPLDGFSWNLIISRKSAEKIKSFVKIWSE